MIVIPTANFTVFSRPFSRPRGSRARTAPPALDDEDNWDGRAECGEPDVAVGAPEG